LVVPGPTGVPAGGDWLHEPGSILVEKQLAASAQRSGTIPWHALVCNAARLVTQLQSAGGNGSAWTNPANPTSTTTNRTNFLRLIIRVPYSEAGAGLPDTGLHPHVDPLPVGA
jgi:hypothetical protein